VIESGRNHFLTLGAEEASFLMGIERLKPLGIQLQKAPLNERGILTPEALEKVLSPRTGLVSLSWANGVTGIVQPIAELAEVCQKKEVPFHVDVSDALGKRYFRFEDLPIDYLTFDGERLYGPKGTGGLISRRPLGSFISGGMEQEGRRGGALNLPGLMGLGIAFEECEAHFNHVCLEIARLRQAFETNVIHGLPDAKVLLKEGERLPSVSLITFPGVRSELLAFHLAKQGIYVGLGGGRHQTIERLLLELGFDSETARCTLSFSLGRETTETELQKVCSALVDAVSQCQTLSKEICT